MTAPPLIGEFAQPGKKKRPHIRTEVMERTRLGTSETFAVKKVWKHQLMEKGHLF
jgi:hypothetical protein